MTIQKRSAVMGLIVVFFLMLYGAAKINSPYLLEYTVGKMLVQKAPAGTDTAEIQQRFQALLAAAPDQSTRVKLLLRISEQLEKVQELSLRDMAGILDAENAGVFIR